MTNENDDDDDDDLFQVPLPLDPSIFCVVFLDVSDAL
jgi:hypothetical protein